MIKFFEKSKDSKSEKSPEPLEIQVNKLSARLLKSQEELAAGHKELSVLKGQISDLQSELTKERRLSGEWATKISVQSITHQREIQNAKDELEKLRSELDAARLASSAKEQDLKAARQSTEASSDQLLEANAAYVELELRLNQLQSEKKATENQLIAVRHKLTGASESLSASQHSVLLANEALKTANDNAAQQKNQLEAQVSELKNQLADFKSQLATKESAAGVAQAQANKLESDLSAASAQIQKMQEELSASQKQNQAAQSASEQKAKELQDVQDQLANLQAQVVLQNSDGEKSLHDLEASNHDLHQQLDDVRAQLNALLSDTENDHEMLVLQIAQLQDESAAYCEDKRKFEKLYEVYRSRWERLEKRIPNLIDFGALSVVEVDTVSDVPAVVWGVSDFAQSGFTLPNFNFATVLVDGHPGIVVVPEGETEFASKALVPKYLATDSQQVALFMQLTASTYRQLDAAVKTLEQFELTQWKTAALPSDFDVSFWRPFIKTLIAQFKALPATLRYDRVKLKRELINPDYEHLWLEFHDLVFGSVSCKKFEVRLGAALIQPGAFSLYPKFEIPLVDGKDKPFDSWFAESYDDSGAKLELRFALERNIFDVAVWSKLSEADRAIVMRLIYGFPDALKRLEKDKVSIHRPWQTWIDFAASAIRVLEKLRASQPAPAKPDAGKPASVPLQQVATANSAKATLSTTAVTTPVRNGPRVITFDAKPQPRPAAKKAVAQKAVAQKAVTAKPEAKATKAPAKPVAKPVAKKAAPAKAAKK